MKDHIEYKGELIIHVNDVLVLHKKNLVVTTGKAMGVTRLVSNTAALPLASIGVGSGTTAPAIGDQTLQTSLNNRAFDAAATVTGNTASMTTTFPAGVATGTITEAGLFNNVTGVAGTMFSRTTFTGIPKGAGDVVAVTWQVTGN